MLITLIEGKGKVERNWPQTMGWGLEWWQLPLCRQTAVLVLKRTPKSSN